MRKSKSARAAQPDPSSLPLGLQQSLLLAVRLSATRQGAPAGCRRQSCRGNGRCRARLDTAGLPDCKADLNAATANEVVGMLLFAFLLAHSRPGGEALVTF